MRSGCKVAAWEAACSPVAASPLTSISETDSSKARSKLDWKPTVSFPELVKMMVDADIAAEAKA